jgi:nicotinamidase-related amidase
MNGLKAELGLRTIHLCIDMQRLFSREGPWPTPWMERVLPMVTRLVERLPSHTVFTRFVTPAVAEDMPGMWRAYYHKWREVTRSRIHPSLLGLMPELQRYVPPAVIFDKMVYSAFAAGEFHAFLQKRQVSALIVSGSETDVCVLSSVLAAIDYGYRVVIASDAVCSSSDASHDALIELYNCRFDVQIEVATVDEILQGWHL